ncbi:MAG: hypothetical protein GY820_48410, partial [Gammaproteobacteria bacterium]|nr:hypothetical protein [Gammaproteobacteria bacterium]
MQPAVLRRQAIAALVGSPGPLSLNVCMDCQMQTEKQLRDSNKGFYVEADRCNRPMGHGG